MASATRTGSAVRNRAMELGGNANEGNAAWRTSADALTRACKNAGWATP